MTQHKIEILGPAKGAKATTGGNALGSAGSAAHAVKAVKSIAKAVVEHHRVKEENITAREAIREQSSVIQKQIAANREALAEYVKNTFDDRDAALDGLISGLDKAIESGNVELAKSMADSIANIVKSGPLIQAADLVQSKLATSPVFRLGKSSEA